MEDIKILPLQVKDIPRILEIERQVFSSPWNEEVFLQELNQIRVSRSFIAVNNNIIAGYVIAWFVADEIHLINIAVDPGYRRKGIGSGLLSFIIKLAEVEGRKLITLEVRLSNTAAQGFYKSFSFHIMGIRKGYYSDNQEDALLMMLDVDEYRRSTQTDKREEEDPR